MDTWDPSFFYLSQIRNKIIFFNEARHLFCWQHKYIFLNFSQIGRFFEYRKILSLSHPQHTILVRYTLIWGRPASDNLKSYLIIMCGYDEEESLGQQNHKMKSLVYNSLYWKVTIFLLFILRIRPKKNYFWSKIFWSKVNKS